MPQISSMKDIRNSADVHNSIQVAKRDDAPSNLEKKNDKLKPLAISIDPNNQNSDVKRLGIVKELSQDRVYEQRPISKDRFKNVIESLGE